MPGRILQTHCCRKKRPIYVINSDACGSCAKGKDEGPPDEVGEISIDGFRGDVSGLTSFRKARRPLWRAPGRPRTGL